MDAPSRAERECSDALLLSRPLQSLVYSLHLQKKENNQKWRAPLPLCRPTAGFKIKPWLTFIFEFEPLLYTSISSNY